jgi:hypothetical protein
MKDNIRMESLEDFLSENHKMNSDVTNEDRIHDILKDFNIDVNELEYSSFRDEVHRMAAELYDRRSFEYERSGWVNPN